MNSKITQSIAFLNEMMESIPKSVDKEFSSEVKKAFTVKKIKDIGKKCNVTLKGSDKDILDIFEKFLYAFVKAYVTSSGGQVGGGGNSPNQIVPYNPRRAVTNTLIHILSNIDLYISAGVVVYQGILVYMGAQQINIILSAPIAHTYNSQNQPMGTELVIHGEGGNQVAVIDLTNINIRPISIYDVLTDPRGTMADITTDITLQLEQARNNAMTRARTEITRQFDLRRQELADRYIRDMGLTGEDAAAFRRLAGIRNIMTGEQFGRMGEDALREGRYLFEDIQRGIQRSVENASRNVSRKVEETGVQTVRTFQDAFGMISEGSFYFISFGLSYIVYRCLRRRNRGRRNRGRRTRRNGALENTNNGPEFDYLNNNQSKYGGERKGGETKGGETKGEKKGETKGETKGGKRTRRKRKHKKIKKSRKKHRIRRKKSRKSRKSRRSKK